MGSPTDEFSFCLNLFYASSFDVKAHPQFQHKWAIVRPEDKKWTFTQDLTNVVQTDTGKLIKNSDVEWFNLPNAMAVISTEIRPVLVVPHLFCLDGATKCRYLHLEVLNPPLSTNHKRGAIFGHIFFGFGSRAKHGFSHYE